MPSLLITLDDATLETLNRIAPPGERRRSQFVRDAIRKAVMAELEAQSRAGYQAIPDTEDDADAWEMPEEYRR